MSHHGSPISPGAPHTFVAAAVGSVVIHADFDRSGSMNKIADERRRRVLRPGAILLPNLDIDDPLPPIPVGGSPPDLKNELDAKKDANINAGNDRRELTDMEIQSPVSAPSTDEVVLKVASNDANRIRIFKVISGQQPNSWPVVIGDGSAGPTKEKYKLPFAPRTSWQSEFVIEARTLPWHPDPDFCVPSDPIPVPPAPDPGGQPFLRSSGGVSSPANTTNRSQPIYPSRAPADVWVELLHFVGGVEATHLKEVGLFTIAPFILLSNLQPVEQVYVVYWPSDNHDFVYDLAEACRAALGAGVMLPPNTSTSFTPHTRGHTGSLYIADGTRYSDQWIQDQFEIGYCWAPHAHMHVILHCKRAPGEPLAAFVRSELPGPEMGLYDSIHGPGDSLNFGGNLEVAPPVSVATPGLSSGPAGPAVPAQPAAPFGKILLGNSTVRPVDPDFREFLKAQKVQPLLEIDTSWLAVAHVDEIISFVPATGVPGFKLLIASILTAQRLLNHAKAIPAADRTDLFRGKSWRSGSIPRAAGGVANARISVEDLLSRAEASNEEIRQRKLRPIQRRLKTALNLNDSDIIRIPVYFDQFSTSFSAAIAAGERTVAFTPGMVNMLVVNRHVMIPKPFAVRLKKDAILEILSGIGIIAVYPNTPQGRVAAEAEKGADTVWQQPWGWECWIRKQTQAASVKLSNSGIIAVYPNTPQGRVAAEAEKGADTVWQQPWGWECWIRRQTQASSIKLDSRGMGISTVTSARLDPLIGHWCWASVGETPAVIATTYGLTEAAILGDHRNAGLVSGPLPGWRRIWIPEDNVDLFEAYVKIVLEDIGLTVHFIDDWYTYHRMDGEVHCGTNAKRTPPEARAGYSGTHWWEFYERLL